MAENPGSYNDFVAREGLIPGPDAIEAHSVAIDGFMAALAKEKNIHPDDLHRMPINYHSNEEAVA